MLVTTEMHSGDDAAIIASKVQACVSRPVFANGQRILIGASIGISLYPDQGSDADRLISLADEAMYRVKKSGKNGFAFASDIAP